MTRRTIVPIAAAAVLMTHVLGAQDIKIPVNINQLAAKASSSVDVTLDGELLNLATQFMTKESKATDPDLVKMVTALKGIYVRSFAFENAGAIPLADVEAVRAQLKPPLWQRPVSARDKAKGEDVDVFVKQEGGVVTGLVIIAVEPKELTIVNLVGRIDPAKIGRLSGQFGIPKLEPLEAGKPEPGSGKSKFE